MKTKHLLSFIVSLIFTAGLMAQVVPPLQYDITFRGRGEATSVQTVKVENLSLGTELTMSGSDILRLTNTPSGVDDVEFATVVKPVIFPNPSFGVTQIVFASRTNGNVCISVSDLSGKVVLTNTFYLESGKYSAVLPGIKSGIHIVTLRGPGINESVKWTSMGGDGASRSIRIEGAGSANLLTMNVPKTKNTNVASNIVEMSYNTGNLLRFTGKNGDMTTIVMNQPTLSHPITFDFYKCTDATGRHYPIVNVGGVLWMAEDLGVISTKASIRSNQSAWSNYTNAKVAYRNYDATDSDRGGYYNWKGAKAALPTGWNLPTAGEVDAMFKMLGMNPIVNARTKLTTGYTNQRPDLLRGRDNSWAMPINDPDTTSFGAMATGTLNTAGVFSYDMDNKSAFWTRSTKSSIPIWWGVSENNVLLASTQTTNEQGGMRVRGCRPAPSAYADVIDLFRGSSSGAPQRAPQVFESGPLGGIYTISTEKKKIFADYSSSRPLDNTGTNNGNKQFYRYDYRNGAYSKTRMPNNGMGVSNYLKKAIAVNNGRARENLVVAIWNRPTGIWLGADNQKINGTGTVSLVMYKDSADGYARLDSITLPGTFTMERYARGAWNGNHHQYYAWFYGNNLASTYENYMSRFQILAADFDQDGVDELVVSVDRKVVIYKKNASNNEYTQWSGRSRTFATKRTTTYVYNEDTYGNVRLAVGDVNGDRIPDIAAVYEVPTSNPAPGSATYQWTVEVYPGGNLGATAAYNKSFIHINGGGYPDGSSQGRHYETFEDIKIGNVTGHSVNNIVAMAAQPGNSPTVCVFEYNPTETGGLKNLATYSSGSLQAFDTDGGGNISYKKDNFNFNVTLCNFDGGGKSDIVAGLDILKYSETGNGSLIKKTTTKLSGDNWFVHNDLIVAGNFNGNDQGKEQLSVLHMKTGLGWAGSSTNDTRYTWKQISHDIINVEGSTYRIISEIEGSGDNIPHCMNTDLKGSGSGSSYSIVGVNAEYNNIPFIAAARSAEAAKTLQYVSHSSSMTEPRIYALLAAPPFWKYKPDGSEYDYTGATSMGTAWGKTTTSGSGSSRSSSNKGMLILGFEKEFNAPIFSKKLGGIDFETQLEWEATQGSSVTYTEEQSIEWTAPQNDAVILSATFYDTYNYKVIAAEDLDEIDGIVSIFMPESTPRTMALNLTDYKVLMADSPESPKLDDLFVHKVGYPFTYPNSKEQIVSNVPVNENDANNATPSKVLWAQNDGFPEFINVGSGNDCTRSILLTSERETETGFNFNLEATFVATSAIGIKAGVGYGHGESWANQHSEGVGHAVAGTVPAPFLVGDVPNFQWTLAWYKYQAGNQTFPIVYYVVKQ